MYIILYIIDYCIMHFWYRYIRVWFIYRLTLALSISLFALASVFVSFLLLVYLLEYIRIIKLQIGLDDTRKVYKHFPNIGHISRFIDAILSVIRVSVNSIV